MREDRKIIMKEILEWIYCFFIAIILALLVRYYVGTPTIVQQTSMYPTLKSGERLWLNRLYRTFNLEKKRGDIITFEAPTENYMNGEIADLANPTAKYENEKEGLISKFCYNVIEYKKISYIKRIIGLPGEHIQIKNGKVFINGEELKEDYLEEGLLTEDLGGQFIDVVVPENTVFVMGDNRDGSMDSRKFGCIPFEKIEGVVGFRFWPISLLGKVK